MGYGDSMNRPYCCCCVISLPVINYRHQLKWLTTSHYLNSRNNGQSGCQPFDSHCSFWYLIGESMDISGFPADKPSLTGDAPVSLEANAASQTISSAVPAVASAASLSEPVSVTKVTTTSIISASTTSSSRRSSVIQTATTQSTAVPMEDQPGKIWPMSSRFVTGLRENCSF